MNDRNFQQVAPVDMAWSDTGDAIIVWSDGHRSTYTRPYLRSLCPCADCTGAHTGVPQALALDDGARDTGDATTVIAAEPVGNYAICFTWGDGHRHGIYAFRYLRAKCACPECVRRQSEGHQEGA